MKTIPLGMFALFHWLTTTLISAVLSAAVVLALGYYLLTTNNPVKDEVKAQAKRAFKEEVKGLIFGSQSSP